MSIAMTDLVTDHDAILSALDVLSKIINFNSDQKNINDDNIFDILNYFREFADSCHHGKEEGFLFPAMIAAGVPDHGGPIGVMMAEHIQGRGYLHSMLEALEEQEDYTKFERSGRAYVDLLRIHIQKENEVLFPMADRVILPAELESMYLAFMEHKEKIIGHGRHQELLAMLDKLTTRC